MVDALLAADPYLRISERIRDPKRFTYLNDSILLEIESSTDKVTTPHLYYRSSNSF